MKIMRFLIVSALIAFASLSQAATYTLSLGDSPTVRLSLDRKYSVFESDGRKEKPKKDLRAYMLSPKDEQSSVVFALGRDGHPKTERDISEMFGGAKIKKVEGQINGEKVQWWHYRDAKHLYSTCGVTLKDKQGKEHFVYIDLVANTTERLTALENAFSRIDFL